MFIHIYTVLKFTYKLVFFFSAVLKEVQQLFACTSKIVYAIVVPHELVSLSGSRLVDPTINMVLCSPAPTNEGSPTRSRSVEYVCEALTRPSREHFFVETLFCSLRTCV